MSATYPTVQLMSGVEKLIVQLATPASAAAPPVNTVLPVASGSVVVGGSLSVTTGTWTNIPTSFTYQWRNAGTPIGGATASTYTPILADVTGGPTIDCVVTAHNTAGDTAATSNGLTATASAILSSLVTTLGGWWWDKNSGITIDTGVSAWVDRIAGATVSQATGSKQPTFDAVTGLSFASASAQLLKLAAPTLLTGAPGYTCMVFGSQTSAGNTSMVSYGQNGSQEFFLGMFSGSFIGYLRSDASSLNGWLTAVASPVVLGCYMSQGQWSDGTTGQKAVQKDTVSMGGSRAFASNVNAGAFTSASANMVFGAYNNSGSAMDGTIRHVVLLPSQITQGNINLINGYLHTIEGV